MGHRAEADTAAQPSGGSCARSNASEPAVRHRRTPTRDLIAPKNSSRSAALMNAGVDLRHAHLRLDVTDPFVMGDAFLGRAGEAEDRGSQSASGDC
jgi:hypothetical protein